MPAAARPGWEFAYDHLSGTEPAANRSEAPHAGGGRGAAPRRIKKSSGTHGRNALSQSMERTSRAYASERADTTLHWSAPDSRGHQPSGVRHDPSTRLEGRLPGTHRGDDRPHRADELAEAPVP